MTVMLTFIIILQIQEQNHDAESNEIITHRLTKI